jgi:hypothetical protein
MNWMKEASLVWFLSAAAIFCACQADAQQYYKNNAGQWIEAKKPPYINGESGPYIPSPAERRQLYKNADAVHEHDITGGLIKRARKSAGGVQRAQRAENGLPGYPYSCCADLSNGSAGGSATFAAIDSGGNAILFSCGHIFLDDNDRPMIRNPVATFCNGEKMRCRVLDVDYQLDVSALKCKAPTGIATTRCVRKLRPSDSEVIAVGFPWYAKNERGSRNPWPHCVRGKLLGVEGNDIHFIGHGQTDTGKFVHSGFSGGGLVTPEGDLVGVVCGFSDGRRHYNYAPAIVEFASRFMKVEAE